MSELLYDVLAIDMTTQGGDMSEDDDYDDYLKLEESPLGEMGCLFPGECCMPGDHYTSECHTAEDVEAWHKENAEGI